MRRFFFFREVSSAHASSTPPGQHPFRIRYLRFSLMPPVYTVFQSVPLFPSPASPVRPVGWFPPPPPTRKGRIVFCSMPKVFSVLPLSRNVHHYFRILISKSTFLAYLPEGVVFLPKRGARMLAGGIEIVFFLSFRTYPYPWPSLSAPPQNSLFPRHFALRPPRFCRFVASRFLLALVVFEIRFCFSRVTFCRAALRRPVFDVSPLEQASASVSSLTAEFASFPSRRYGFRPLLLKGDFHSHGRSILFVVASKVSSRPPGCLCSHCSRTEYEFFFPPSLALDGGLSVFFSLSGMSLRRPSSSSPYLSSNGLPPFNPCFYTPACSLESRRCCPSCPWTATDSSRGRLLNQRCPSLRRRAVSFCAPFLAQCTRRFPPFSSVSLARTPFCPPGPASFSALQVRVSTDDASRPFLFRSTCPFYASVPDASRPVPRILRPAAPRLSGGLIARVISSPPSRLASFRFQFRGFK